jgi:hypothetical protein
MPRIIGTTGWNKEHTLRVINVGEHVEITESDVPDGALIAMTECETWLDSNAVQFMAVSMLAWFGFCGLPGEHEDNPLAEIITHIAHVQDELENWNVRAREDEEHPPYDKLCTSLEEALQRLRRMQEILMAEH